MEGRLMAERLQPEDPGCANGGASFTIDEAIESSGFGRFQALLFCYTGMAWLADAMEMILLSFIGPAARCLWHLTPFQEGSITSAVFAGVFLGSYCWGALSDWKGRRLGFLATAVFTFALGLLSALSPSFWVLLLSRSLVGFGLGGSSVMFSLLMEFVPSSSRGFWLVCIAFFWTAGSVLEALLAWAVLPTLHFRWLLGISALPFLPLLIGFLWLPESPRYLLVKGDREGALAVLQYMSRVNRKPLPGVYLVDHPASPTDTPQGAPPGPSASLKYGPVPSDTPQEHKQPPPQERLSEASWGVLKSLLSPPLRRITVLLWGVFFANAFVYYGLVLLTTQLAVLSPEGGPSKDCSQGGGATVKCSPEGLPLVPTSTYRDVLITSFAELPGLLVAAYTIESIGRKSSLVCFLGFCGVCLVPLFAPLSEALTTLLLFGSRAAIMGAFTILWAFGPELYPTSVRSTGLGLANAFGRVGGFLCPLVAVYLVSACQRGLAVALFAGVSFLAAFGMTLFPHDTKGRALEDTL